MLRKRSKRRRMSLAQRLRQIGPQLHTAYRHARAALWRFRRSPVRQDRAAMLATFVCIGVFTAWSVDAIVTGGADFGPSPAYAVEYREPIHAPTALAAPAAPEEAPPVLKTAMLEDVDYSFTTEVLLGGPEEPLAIEDTALLDLEETLALEAEKTAL
jgi:hypothetical protein